MAAFKEQKKIPVLHVCDFETGGLDATKCGITQWTVQLVRADDWSTIAVFNTYVKPYSKTVEKKETKKRLKSKFEDDNKVEVIPMEYTDKALSVTGITIEKLESEGIEIEDAVEQYFKFLESNKIDGGSKPLVCGQNITFDIDFLFAFVSMVPDGIKRLSKLVQGTKFKVVDTWVPKYLDTLLMAKSSLYHEIDDYSLESLCSREGIDVDIAHDSLYDVDATANLFKLYLSRMKASGGADIVIEEKEKQRNHFQI